MKRAVIFLLSAICVFMIYPQNVKTMKNDYGDLWLKVAEYEKKSLPQSALKVVDEIIEQAMEDDNSPQLIKAVIHKGKYNIARDEENFTSMFDSLDGMLVKSKDPVEKAVLHSMLGQLYLEYYDYNEWTINQRTDLKGFVPDDINEWTKNIFYDKVVEHIIASLEPQDVLANTQVESYSAIIDMGKDSRDYFPTMFDFLAGRAVQYLEMIKSDIDLSRMLARRGLSKSDLFVKANDFVNINLDPGKEDYNLWVYYAYQKWLKSLIDRGMSESVLLTELHYIENLNSSFRSKITNIEISLPLLYELLEDWKDKPESVEVVDRIADYHLRWVEDDEEDTEEDLKTERAVYDMLVEYIDKYPNYKRVSTLKNRLNDMTRSYANVSGNTTFPINGKKEFEVEFKNINSLAVKVYKLNSPLDALNLEYNYERRTRYNKQLLKTISVSLPTNLEKYEKGKVKFSVDVDEPGVYMLDFDTNPAEKNKDYNDNLIFAVSRFTIFSRYVSENNYDFFVVDRSTGEPIEDADIKIYKLPGNWRNSKLTLVETIKTDRQGYATYHKDIPNNDVFFHAVKGADQGSLLNRLPYGYMGYRESRDDGKSYVNIFTDRALYRPGQTVYFKAILISNYDGEDSVLPNKKQDFTLKDANGKEISTQTLISNEYGSVSGEFVLPKGLLTGVYTLETDGGTINFRVEEYKRPTFEVTFDKIDKTYSFGEEIKLTGKVENFSGIKVQDATVDWKIERQQPWWWAWYNSPEHFAEGATNTDDNGEFEVSFTPKKRDSQDMSRSIYSFILTANVTDVNGETQVGRYIVNVGDVSMVLQVEMQSKFNKKSDDKIVIRAKNLDGNDIDAKGNYKLYTLQDDDSIGQQVRQGEFVAGEQKELKEKLVSLSSGRYRLMVESKDDSNETVVEEKDFVLFSYEDEKPPFNTNDWYLEKKLTFSESRPAEVILGASDKVNVLYELWNEKELIERKWVILNANNKRFEVPYKSEYKNGVTLMLTFVKDEKFHSHRAEIKYEREPKNLDVKLDVFRDKILPGTQEEWRLTVKDTKGNPATAEVLASMYDASLDKLYEAPVWKIRLKSFDSNTLMNSLNSDRSFREGYVWLRIYKDRLKEYSFDYDRLNLFGLSYSEYNGLLEGNVFGYTASPAPRSTRMALAAKSSLALQEMVVVEDQMLAADEYDDAEVDMEDDEQNEEEAQVRKNFNETAFFYPMLRTNKDGETQVSFKVPDSNTRWRFRVVAHDKDLRSGYAESFCVSQKELMVTPNMPRFLRHGDKTTIAAKVSNLSDEAQSGIVYLELFDPTTEEIISNIQIDSKEQSFALEQQASTSAEWTFVVPKDIDVLGVRVVARTSDFSDGEQHALAVLPNRMLVTESMRMDVKAGEEKSFEFKGLSDGGSSTRDNYRLTLEFTSNPAWYAIQALPVLGQPVDEDAISWFASYYANSLAEHIGKAYPRVVAMIEQWKKQGGDANTLLSSLDKNEELKAVLLEETPWVMEAKDETEQKEKLALLFDINRSSYLKSIALDKLRELQTYDGGWSWFKGFYPNVGITQYVLYGFNQLKELGIGDFSEEVVSMQNKALGYIDDEALNRFEMMKKYNKDWRKIKHISIVDLEYLLVRGAYPNYPMSSEVKEMIDFYNTVIAENWTEYDLYERSHIVMIMQRLGKRPIIKDIIDSYREHATITDEMGMFWANNTSNVFMPRSAVTVHTFIMDAFKVANAGSEEMDMMKQWLLKQKQTQQWESTHATLDAIYALLSNGSDWFSEDGKTNIVVGRQLISTDDGEAGTGYIKESWSKENISSDMKDVTVMHEGNTPAWGAMYVQYFEDLDKIGHTDASLDVEKMMFVEKTDEHGTKLEKIHDNGSLKVGDKVVVRLTVRTDRDMEFVHIKDSRAVCFEPTNQLSGVKWQNSIMYYATSKDASTNMYFDVLPRGTYVFEYSVFVTHKGVFSNGITTIQSMYAPEFTSHTAGIVVSVE